MKILGIHDGHNASICLVEDGKIAFAIQEERLTSEKNKGGFPFRSIEFMLKHLHLGIKDIDAVAMASIHTSTEFETGDYYSKEKKTELRKFLERAAKKTPLYRLYTENRRRERLQNLRIAGFGSGEIRFVGHHLCHAATAYFGSHFPHTEKILVLTNDGAGDGLCATVSIGENGRLKRIAKVKSANSLARIYCLVTKMLGFKPLEHEYKLMGMAPYCSEKGTAIGHGLFKDLVRISPGNPLAFERTSTEATNKLLPLLQERFKFQRFDNICAGLQKFTEDVLVQWVSNCVKHTGISKIALAGGIFMNVKANKKIMELLEVEDMFVFPSCGDETISIGAAYHIYGQMRGQLPEIEPIGHFYLGDDFSDEETLDQIKKYQKEFSFKHKKVKNIEEEIARLLAKKQVVARCKGRMEFGARALGNRSILADPSGLHCVREINLMVKKRDFWMPFAPVMLQEQAKKYIVNPKNIAAPYMILSFDTTQKYEELIAAVHQADLTARPQVITQKMNPEYYAILKKFEKITGGGVLLNTSFNLHGFPIVRGPKEALEVFRDSELKYLAVGDYLLEKINY